MSEKTVVEILEGGLDYLRKNGWRRGYFGYEKPGDTCKACALGAIYAAGEVPAGNFWGSPINIRSAVHCLNDELPSNAHGSVTYFNDAIAKRRRDVERVFARAIKKAKLDAAESAALTVEAA